MDLRRLRLFLAVVDEGGMTRAAEAEHVSQPSVSQAVRELEAELGTALPCPRSPSIRWRRSSASSGAHTRT